jgi:nucleoside 2-deoxyribosyltransferase
MKIYLASPFFSHEEVVIYRQVIEDLRRAGYDVYVPQEHTIEGAWEMSNREWARRVFEEDVTALCESECVMVLNFGMYSDSGTAWEAGYAYAFGTHVIHVLCGGENATYSLMMMNGCNKVVNLRDVVQFQERSSWVDFDKVIQK